MYFHRSTLGPVDLAFTDRYGGVSGVPYDELNLALVGGDAPEATAENLRIVTADFAPDADLGPPMGQVHGAEVVPVTAPAAAGDGPVPCDGQVTDVPGLVLVVRAADCVPVLLADPDAGVVGVAHSGRPGLAAGIVPATVARMRALGARRVTAWIGPHVCGSCYEVPAAMQAEVGALVPAAVSTTSWGTPALDIGAGVRAQLADADVAVVDVSACTRESLGLYSYRRDGERAGRHAGLIRVRR